MKILWACLTCVAVFTAAMCVFFIGYMVTCSIGGYMIVEDEVTIKAENGREFKYVRTTDPWFGITKSTKPVIVPAEE